MSGGTVWKSWSSGKDEKRENERTLYLRLVNAVSLGGDSDTLACITGGIAEAFYGMPQELRAETLKRLPEDLRAAYELFRQNLERRM